MTWIAILGGSLAVLVLVSYLVDAARPAPRPPDHQAWAPGIPVRYLDLNGVRLRYLAAGDGPALVLLHTLRTQLDMFRRVVPELAKHFQVYALDYPGHGWSDIPQVDYDAEYFVDTVARFLDALGVESATVVGESIGGTGARGNRVSPPQPAAGAERLPWRRLQSRSLLRRAATGAFAGRQPSGPLPGLPVPGSPLGKLEDMRREYARIDCPTLLIYGEHDWSREAEREANRRAIPRNHAVTVPEAGHFLALEAPGDLARAVTRFARQDPA